MEASILFLEKNVFFQLASGSDLVLWGKEVLWEKLLRWRCDKMAGKALKIEEMWSESVTGRIFSHAYRLESSDLEEES